MPKIKVMVEKWKCGRKSCGHEWNERVETEHGKPFVCPKCKSPRWDVEEKKEKKK